MKVSHYQCRRCHTCFPAQTHRRDRWLAAGVGAAIGGALTRSFLWSFAFGGASYWAAGKVDALLGARCPICHELGEAIVEPQASPLRSETEAARAA